MSLLVFQSHVLILMKHANIKKISPSSFVSSAHKITLALFIVTFLMIIILASILIEIRKGPRTLYIEIRPRSNWL